MKINKHVKLAPIEQLQNEFNYECIDVIEDVLLDNLLLSKNDILVGCFVQYVNPWQSDYTMYISQNDDDQKEIWEMWEKLEREWNSMKIYDKEKYIYNVNSYLIELYKVKNDKNGNKKYKLEFYKNDGYGNYMFFGDTTVFEYNTSLKEAVRILNIAIDKYNEKCLSENKLEYVSVMVMRW